MKSDAVARRQRSGVALVLGATAISAASSFLVLLIVAPALGPAGYAVFSVYWAALFMIVGVLFGVQQESTRVVAEPDESRPQGSTSLMRFAMLLGCALLVVLLATGPLWSEALFEAGSLGWVLPLAIGAASFASVAALNGILAGRMEWTPFALLPVVDGLLRLVLVGGVLAAGWGGLALAWAVAIPFPVSLAVTWFVARRTVHEYGLVAESYRRLSANTFRTMLASAATAVLVNGFPVILSLFGRTDQATLGAVILALMLTRAPILVPLTAMQSMLIAKFSAKPAGRTRLLVIVVGGLAMSALLLSGVVFLWGESLLRWFFGEGYALSGLLLAGLVIAAGCLGVLTATGAAVLSMSRHNAFAAGWLIASIVAVLVVALAPAELGARTVLALCLGPLLGSIVHLIAGRSRAVASMGHTR